MTSQALNEGQSTFRLPYLNENDYKWWKAKWKLIFNHLIISCGIWWKNGIKGIELRKPEDKWDQADMKWDTLNKAKNASVCALNTEEFNRVSNCETAKEVWDTLEVTHQTQTKRRNLKRNILTSQYELLNMENDASIMDMFV